MMAAGRTIFVAFVFSIVVSVAVCLDVTIPQKMYEHARGDNITIPCNFKPQKPDNPVVIVSWTAEGDKAGDKELSVLTFYHTNGAKSTVDVTPRYERRASLDHDLRSGKVNLKLSSITLEDNKVFECRVQIPRDDTGVLAATTRLVVLVAPSTPICDVQGTPEYGQNINLTCKSEEGSPPPTYKWESRDVRNMPRNPQARKDPRNIDKNGILSLFNVTHDTSGYYTCTSTNKIRSASCNITLAVTPPSLMTARTGGIIGGVIAGILVLMIIICVCCRMKKKEKDHLPVEYNAGVAEAEYTDTEPAENGVEIRRRDEERSEQDDRRSDYDDRRSDYDDRRSDYNDRRSDYTDRRSDYGDGRSDRYPERRDDRDYDDRRDRYDDRRDDDRRDRYDDDRDHYDDRDRSPSVPANKPNRPDYDV